VVRAGQQVQARRDRVGAEVLKPRVTAQRAKDVEAASQPAD
jgi:hypothetical protein